MPRHVKSLKRTFGVPVNEFKLCERCNIITCQQCFYGKCGLCGKNGILVKYLAGEVIHWDYYCKKHKGLVKMIPFHRSNSFLKKSKLMFKYIKTYRKIKSSYGIYNYDSRKKNFIS